ncbi:fungal hydrophobin [Dichomitus squalens]|uniref:Hydrophobin n=1 Tax=Dichomitus squalens TaxID=114155 RepID=A0A4Q9N2V3_9APHY|nr:fungal hydrophobin [Dichomitus squalens]
MFSKLAITAALSALLAVATALPAPKDGDSGGKCTTGKIHCCNTVGRSDDSSFTNNLPSLVQGLIKGLDTVIGVDCDPITIIGGTLAGTCSAHPVCCENNSTGGLVNIGCVPVTA